MPRALGEAEMGPPNPEIVGSRSLLAARRVREVSVQDQIGGAKLIKARVDSKRVELFINADGLISRGSCTCSHHYQNGVRKGPCRHLLAARDAALTPPIESGSSIESWYEWLNRAGRN